MYNKIVEYVTQLLNHNDGGAQKENKKKRKQIRN